MDTGDRGPPCETCGTERRDRYTARRLPGEDRSCIADHGRQEKGMTA